MRSQTEKAGPFRSRACRALAYAAASVTGEVVFTATNAALGSGQRKAALEGHSYIWMLPLYGSAAWLFEPVHDALRGKPPWLRGAAYAAGIIGVEYASGMALKKATGVIPWDYSGHSRFSVGGAIRLDYLPIWAAAGFAFERLHDALTTAADERAAAA